MKETLYTRNRNTVDPMMVKNDGKATLQALHTDAIDNYVKSHERNVVLDGCPPPISSSERDLTRKERSTLDQLRSGYCRLMGSYKQLFVFPAHPTTMILSDLWSRPTDAVREVS